MKKKSNSLVFPTPQKRTKNSIQFNVKDIPTLKELMAQCEELKEYNDALLTTSTGNIYIGSRYMGRTPWYDEDNLIKSIL